MDGAIRARVFAYSPIPARQNIIAVIMDDSRIDGSLSVIMSRCVNLSLWYLRCGYGNTITAWLFECQTLIRARSGIAFLLNSRLLVRWKFNLVKVLFVLDINVIYI